MKDCCDSWHLGSEIKQIKYLKLLKINFQTLGKMFKFKN